MSTIAKNLTERAEENLSNQHIYSPNFKKSEHVFKERSLFLYYKNVLIFNEFILKLQDKNISEEDNIKYLTKACEVIGITDNILEEDGIEFVEELIGYLNSERFISSGQSDLFELELKRRIELEELTEEEADDLRKKHGSSDVVFSHAGDFDLIQALFMERYSIDLEEENISWFKYLRLLENILEEENNSLVQRISARQFKAQKGDGNEQINKIGKIKKAKYSLV